MSVTVAGARGAVADAREFVEGARRWAAARGGEVQLFDAAMVVGADHLLAAADLAARAFREARNSSETLGGETLLYASGERQVASALRKMGVAAGTTAVAAVAWGCEARDVLREAGLTSDDSVLAGTEAKLLRFGLTPEELATVPSAKRLDLVLERVALGELQRP